MSFRFEPLYGSGWLTIGLALLVIGVIVSVVPPTSDPRQRRWLILLRFVASLALLTVLFRPTIVTTDNLPAAATLVVAVDVSESMALSDGENESRWEKQRQAAEQLATELVAGADRMSIEWIAYDRTSKVVGQNGSGMQTISEMRPKGDGTSLAAPFENVLQLANREPLVGVVLIGDGSDNAQSLRTLGDGRTTASAETPADTKTAMASADQSARVLDSIGVPLWSIPVGPPPRDTTTRDVAVEALPEEYRVYAGNYFNAEFEFVAKGFAGRELPVQIRWIAADGTVQDAASRRLLSNSALDRQAVRVTLETPPPGSYRLEVTATPQEGERQTQNNTQVAFVDVRDGGGRVFVLEGQPRAEQRLLRLALSGFRDLDLAYQWIGEDTRSRWPIRLGDVLRGKQFDVFILGDLEAASLGDEQWRELAEAVAGGAGLITMGGYHAYAAGRYGSSALADVLPVVVPVTASVRPGADAGQLPGPIRLKSVTRHPITDLATEGGLVDWSGLPPMQGASELGPPRRNAPGVEVLLSTTDDQPMLVVGEYGRGRVASLAFDETHRWFRGGQNEVHQRFWRQLILWLLSRDEREQETIEVELDSRRVTNRDEVGFRARSVGSESLPSPSLKWQAVAIGEDGEARDVTIDSQTVGTADSDAEARGRISGLPAGFYTLRITAQQASSELARTGELSFQVVDQNVELANPMADPLYLQQLADLTSQQGGRAYRVDEVDQLVSLIRSRQRESVAPVVDKKSLGDGPLSGWIVFACFSCAMVTEWILRRRWGLV